MKKINNNLFKTTGKELRKLNASDFDNNSTIYINDKYVVHLKKEKYNTYSLESRLENQKTFKFIMPAFWPVYINEFIHR